MASGNSGKGKRKGDGVDAVSGSIRAHVGCHQPGEFHTARRSSTATSRGAPTAALGGGRPQGATSDTVLACVKGQACVLATWRWCEVRGDGHDAIKRFYEVG